MTFIAARLRRHFRSMWPIRLSGALIFDAQKRRILIDGVDDLLLLDARIARRNILSVGFTRRPLISFTATWRWAGACRPAMIPLTMGSSKSFLTPAAARTAD